MRRIFNWHKLIPGLLCSFLPAVAGAQPNIWVTSSLQRTGPADPAGSGTSVQLFAGKGEYQSFQIVVRAPSGGLTNVNVTVSNLTGPGGAVISNTDFTLFREQFVTVSPSSPNWGGANQPLGAGIYADGLIPFNNPSTGLPITGAQIQAVPFGLSASGNQPIWVDLLVPRTAVPGAYSGTFTVTSDQGSSSGTIALTVWHFTLPVTPALHSSFQYWTADSTAAEEELLRNRISPPTTMPGTQSTLMSNYGLGSVSLGFWSGADVGNCVMSPAPAASQFAAAAAAQQPGLYAFDASADEITACPTLFPTLQQWAYNMHQAGVRNLVTMAPNPLLYDDGSGTDHSAVDIWTMLPVEYNATVSQMPVVLAKGDSLWSYNTVVQDAYSPKWEIDFAPINYRIQPGFISQSLGLTGLLYWRVDDWSSDPWNQVNNTGTFSTNNYPGEGMLVYPGAPVGISGVAPSMRLKWLRDGVDDYEYVAMLKAAGQGTWALGLAASVGADWTNWTRDINLIGSVRQQLGQELDQLSAPPPAPSGLAASGASMSPTLSWETSTGATSYSVYFGTSSNPAVAGATTGTTFAPGTLAAGTTYYWSVSSVNANGSSSSATSSFTTPIALPAAIASASPSNSATGISAAPTLTWSASAGATSYGVYFGTSATPSLVATIAGASYSPGTLTAGTTYHWTVAAINAAGSTASATWSFTTAVALPVAVANASPSNGATGVAAAPTLTWSASAGATSYGVYFGTSATPSLVATIAGTSYSPGTLTAGTTYHWTVAASNAAGSTASATWSFTTAVALPVAVANASPSNGATGVAAAPTLTWSASAGATSYGVYFGTAATPSLVATIAGASYSPGTLTAGTTYYWSVAAINAAGSTASATWSFTTAPIVAAPVVATPVVTAPVVTAPAPVSFPPAVALPVAVASSSPANGAPGISATPTLSWNASLGASSYGVYFGTSATPSLVATTSGISYSPGTLTAGTTYYWSVTATNAAGSTPSATWSFTTAPLPASPLIMGNEAPVANTVSPSGGSGSTVTFRIQFSDVNGQADLAGGGALVNTSIDGQGACWFYYTHAGNTLSLASDSSGTWSAIAQGSAGTIANSQCSISGTGFVEVGAGDSATLLVTVTFNQASFAGTKNVYIIAQNNEGLSSGYRLAGTWKIP